MTKVSFQDVVATDPDIMSGAPVFRGTRVPVNILFEFVADNLTVDEFLRAYPRVNRQQINDLLDVMADDIKTNHLNPTAMPA